MHSMGEMRAMADRLKDKIAIVCGAGASAGGLSNGMATCLVFAREGAKVFAVDRDIALARETERAIVAAGGECTLHQCDVANAAEVERMAQACLDRYGRIDILFNNVGVFAVGGPLDTDEAEFDRVISINLKGTFLTCKAVLPAMLAQGGGAIVNNSSVTALRYQMPSAAYSASKAGVLQLSQNIAVQSAAQGIRCNSVLPGNILTDRLVARLKQVHGERYVDHVKAWGDMVPSGQVGEPWDVAHAVLFLASDEARYINAAELVVDGGLSASMVGHKSG
jgi:NAD(P)-dependent dehydrogenase (short-subunit alcohol dehydrogenase family)